MPAPPPLKPHGTYNHQLLKNCSVTHTFQVANNPNSYISISHSVTCTTSILLNTIHNSYISHMHYKLVTQHQSQTHTDTHNRHTKFQHYTKRCKICSFAKQNLPNTSGRENVPLCLRTTKFDVLDRDPFSPVSLPVYRRFCSLHKVLARHLSWQDSLYIISPALTRALPS